MNWEARFERVFMLTTAHTHSAVCLALTRAISRTRTVEDIYASALDALGAGLGVERAAILLFDPDGVMRFKVYRGLSDAYRRAVEGHTPWQPDTPDPEPIVVTDAAGLPYAVLPASEVVRFIIPQYVQDDPALAGVLDESMADRIAEKLRGKSVREVLPKHLLDVPSARADDTIIEVAALMARLRSPLVAVLKDRRLHGVVTASRLLEAALRP